VRLSDFIPASQVVIPLRQDTVIGAADELIERLTTAGAVSDVEKLRTRVAEERPEDIVAMGDRAFLLHYRTDAVTALRVVLGTAEQPICRELGENETQCARILLLIVAPKKFATELASFGPPGVLGLQLAPLDQLPLASTFQVRIDPT